MDASTQSVTNLSASLRKNAAAFASACVRAARGESRAIHRVRVASRRLREAVPLAASVTRTDESKLMRELRRVTRGLGRARELDVSRDVLAQFAKRAGWPVAIVQEVDEFCQRERSRAFKDAGDVLDAFDPRDVRRRLRALADDIETEGMTPAGQAALLARLHEAARTLIEEVRDAGTLYAPEPLHRVRIAAKKLRYVIELTGETVAGSVGLLKKVQGALGRLHDAQVLQHRILEIAADTGDRGLVATLTNMHRAIETACRKWHADVLKMLPQVSDLAATIGAAAPAVLRPRQIGRPARMRPESVGTPHGRKRIA